MVCQKWTRIPGLTLGWTLTDERSDGRTDEPKVRHLYQAMLSIASATKTVAAWEGISLQIRAEKHEYKNLDFFLTIIERNHLIWHFKVVKYGAKSFAFLSHFTSTTKHHFVWPSHILRKFKWFLLISIEHFSYWHESHFSRKPLLLFKTILSLTGRFYNWRGDFFFILFHYIFFIYLSKFCSLSYFHKTVMSQAVLLRDFSPIVSLASIFFPCVGSV